MPKLSFLKRDKRVITAPSSSDSASASKPKKIFLTGIQAFAVPEIPESAVVEWAAFSLNTCSMNLTKRCL